MKGNKPTSFFSLIPYAFILSTLFSFILLPTTAQAINASACYRVEVFFFKVGESCIEFREKDDKIAVKSFMRTVNIGSLAKRVDDKGEALIDKKTLKPIFFKFYQEEGNFKRYQEYQFSGEKVFVRETKYQGLTDKIERDEKKVYAASDHSDPYTAALYLFENITESSKGIIKLFYDDKFYNVPYTRLKEDKIFIDGIRYDTFKVLIKPNIQGKGLLRPKGDWTLWIDKQSKMPVKMNVGFIIGSVNVLVEELK
ncbi:MAG: hypothetical protein OHK0040_13410 [bacterium]